MPLVSAARPVTVTLVLTGETKFKAEPAGTAASEVKVRAFVPEAGASTLTVPSPAVAVSAARAWVWPPFYFRFPSVES